MVFKVRVEVFFANFDHEGVARVFLIWKKLVLRVFEIALKTIFIVM